MTDERIKELSVAELDEISLGESVDMLRTPDRISMLAFRMSEEIRRRRAEAVAMRPVVEAAPSLGEAYAMAGELQSLRSERRELAARIDTLLENEFGGFYLSAPYDTPLAELRELLARMKGDGS